MSTPKFDPEALRLANDRRNRLADPVETPLGDYIEAALYALKASRPALALRYLTEGLEAVLPTASVAETQNAVRVLSAGEFA